MAAIASGAGVSVQTLYLRHGSKAAILSAALDVAIAGDPEPVALQDRTEDFVVHALAEPDAARAIAIWAHGARTISDRRHRLYDVIRSAAADPEVAEVLDKNRNDRSTGHRMLADALASKHRYDPPSRLTDPDLLYALAPRTRTPCSSSTPRWTPTSGSAGWSTPSAPSSCCPVPR